MSSTKIRLIGKNPIMAKKKNLLFFQIVIITKLSNKKHTLVTSFLAKPSSTRMFLSVILKKKRKVLGWSESSFAFFCKML